MSQNYAALKDKAFSLLDCGDKQGAQSLFEQICEQDSRDSEARMMLGVILAETGDLNAAEKHLALALDLDPDYADAYFYLANIQQSRGQFALALGNAERAVELDPNFHDAQKLLISLQNLSTTSDSNIVNSPKPLKQQLSPDSQATLTRANSLLQENKLDEAESCFEAVIKSYPELATVWFLLGRTRVQQGNFSDAERCCSEAIRLDQNLVEAQMVLAMSLMIQGKFDDASIVCDRALQLQPDNINAIAMAANVAKHMNDPEKSYSLLSPLLEKGVQQINVALAFAMISKDVNKQQQAISLLEKILSSDSSLVSSAISNLHFKLGDLYDDIKQYDKAFSHYKQGNDLKQQGFDQKQFAQYIERYITTHNPESMAMWPRSENTSDRPVFIVGMVRSGTSLLEQILASHPDVYGAGELGDIYQFSKELPEITGSNTTYPECLSELTQQNVDYLAQRYLDYLTQLSPDAKRIIDKLPGNFMHLGLIEVLFPGARIIHCKRDPVDTCLSTYFQDFSTVHP
ncbi:MAG: tetratricopeptide repeat protein, partial [Proteobacteria bacterium]|nr:tetratricopeptide repeat protein [Pseudomonadota bacterium]